MLFLPEDSGRQVQGKLSNVRVMIKKKSTGDFSPKPNLAANLENRRGIAACSSKCARRPPRRHPAILVYTLRVSGSSTKPLDLSCSVATS